MRLSNSKAVSLIQHVLMTLVLGAATHNERRFQFRLGQSRVPSSSGFHG